jgi:AcrR family transcriptional regulator
MSETRKQWLDGALAYVLKNGVANVSLRPMANELGTSPRILMYHFKSKEGLLRAVSGELHSRLQASFVAMMAANTRSRQPAPLKQFWLWAIREENLAYWRLHYELNVLAMQNPTEYGRYQQGASLEWQKLVLEALSASIRSTTMATLAIAVFDGLLLEMMTTGDERRLTRALDHFIAMASH